MSHNDLFNSCVAVFEHIQKNGYFHKDNSKLSLKITNMDINKNEIHASYYTNVDSTVDLRLSVKDNVMYVTSVLDMQLSRHSIVMNGDQDKEVIEFATDLKYGGTILGNTKSLNLYYIKNTRIDSSECLDVDAVSKCILMNLYDPFYWIRDMHNN
jgi:hypothetical protein